MTECDPPDFRRQIEAEQEEVRLDLARITAMERAALLDLWRDLIGPPPKNLSLPFMRQALSFETQLARSAEKAEAATKSLRDTARKLRAALAAPDRVPPGTVLMREWQGRSYRVEAIDDGFVMDGQHFASLTAIAKHITGTHWSGPRFFGLTGPRETDRAGDKR